MKSNSTTAKKGSAPQPKKPANSKKSEEQKPSAATEQLTKLLEDSLKDIYWAEKALTKALPKMINNATSEELQQCLSDHLEQTHGQVTRLEGVFEMMGKKAQAKKCDAMAGLIEEAEGIMEETEEGMMRDLGIIAAGQKVEHYEIATYGTLRAFAQLLGLDAVAAELEVTLEEEKAADEKLTEVTPTEMTEEETKESEEEEEKA